MLYVDGMNGVINHNETIQWLYTLIGSKVRQSQKFSFYKFLVFFKCILFVLLVHLWYKLTACYVLDEYIALCMETRAH